MESYSISNKDIIELKQTMGFRVDITTWNNFAAEHPDGCTSIEMIEFTKRHADPPYDVKENLDEYLENILKSFVKFVRR